MFWNPIGNLRLGQHLVHPHRLGDDLAHRHARIERRIGVLEDDLHALAHRRPSRSRLSSARSTPSKRISPAVGSSSRSTSRPERRLSAARLADQAQRLAALDVERDVVDRAHHAWAAQESAAATGKNLLACLMSRMASAPSARSSRPPWRRCSPRAPAGPAPRFPRRDGRQRGARARPPRTADPRGTFRWRTGSAGGSGSPRAAPAGSAARRRSSRAWRCARDRAAAPQPAGRARRDAAAARTPAPRFRFPTRRAAYITFTRSA